MSGNAALRDELDEASKIRLHGLYRNSRTSSANWHSILILLTVATALRFNCFAYGLGLWEHEDFIRRECRQ